MKPLPPEEGKISQAHTSGVFLEKPGLLSEALKRNQDYKEVVPGSYGQIVSSESLIRSTTLEKSLLKLKEEQASTKGTVALEYNPNDDGKLIVTSISEINGTLSTDIEDNIGDAEFEEFYNQAREAESTVTLNVQKSSESSPGIIKMGESKDPVVVFIRHGRTPHNNLGLFTGWEDPPLAPDGVEDAKNAGRLLKMHGFEFDVVYTSWLQRAIETACKCPNVIQNTYLLSSKRPFYVMYFLLLGYCMDELDCSWLPMVKSWRLNER